MVYFIILIHWAFMKNIILISQLSLQKDLYVVDNIILIEF